MPTGTYVLHGEHGDPDVVERFSCAPGPAGWRYTASRDDGSRIDLTLDRRGRCIRLLAAAGGWEVRGGLADVLRWRRGQDEHEEVAAGFTGTSPAYAVATARLLGLDVGEQRRVRLVALTEPSLAARTVDEGWALTALDAQEGLAVARYEVADLATGERRVVHLAGDVVVAVEGARPVTVVELEGPPSGDA